MRESGRLRKGTSSTAAQQVELRRAACAAMICIALLSCSDSTLTEPRGPGPQPVSPQPIPTSPAAPVTPVTPPVPAAPFDPAFPTLARAGEVYLAEEGLYASIRNLASRFVLYGDGTFALQFADSRDFFEYLGRYTRADSVVTFDWDAWSTAGAWGATATLRGDSLVVRYNVIMRLTDFIDGTYVRSPGTQ